MQTPKIEIKEIWNHSKANETHCKIHISQKGKKRVFLIPIKERRTGVNIESENKETLLKHFNNIADIYSDQQKIHNWKNSAKRFWQQKDASVTKPIFDALSDSKIRCNSCQLPPNVNLQRRIQDIKEFGFTLGTWQIYCDNCQKKTYHYQMIYLPRTGDGKSDYQLFSTNERKKIVQILKNYDCYEDNYHGKNLVVEHKFPEVRWNNEYKNKTKKIPLSNKEYIKEKFQLMTNQRNQQKREVCRSCFQTGKRGTPFGIKFFYEGDEYWDESIEKTGINAESGCQGCGWYDLATWRERLSLELK